MPKIILVEDDRTMLSLMSTLFEMEGFQVVKLGQEQTMEELLKRLNDEQPDILLMDIHIHQINGLDVVQEIRKREGIKNMRVLMASGMDQHDECLSAGADSFIMKPFMPDDLIKRIRTLVNKSKN